MTMEMTETHLETMETTETLGDNGDEARDNGDNGGGLRESWLMNRAMLGARLRWEVNLTETERERGSLFLF